jgi:hypothetical protein
MANRILDPEIAGGDGTVRARRTGDDVTQHVADEAGVTAGSVAGERPIGGVASGKVFVALVLGVWLALVIVLGATRALTVASGTPPYPIAIAVVAPFGVFFAALWLSAGFRSFVSAVDLPLITAVQGWRWAGLGFIFLWAYGVLPGAFAWSAGLGDMAIAITAPWVTLAVVRRPGFATSPLFVVWNLLGILDHVLAVSNAAINQSFATGAPGEITVAPMSLLPLVLIPAYLVPLFDMLHVVALLRTRRLFRATAAPSSCGSRYEATPHFAGSEDGPQAGGRGARRRGRRC